MREAKRIYVEIYEKQWLQEVKVEFKKNTIKNQDKPINEEEIRAKLRKKLALNEEFINEAQYQLLVSKRAGKKA